MTEGDVALASLPQADGLVKPRPVILLCQMPPFGDWLVCGVSAQLHQQVVGFDETIEPSHPDFKDSGLKAPSLIRLGFLAVLPADLLLGKIGSIAAERNTRLRKRLAAFLATS